MSSTGNGSLAGRAMLSTVAVALAAVFVTALVGFGLARGVAESEARELLGRSAQVYAVALRAPAAGERVATQLESQGVTAAVITAQTSVDETVLTASEMDALRAGTRVSDVRRVAGERTLIEARPAGRRAVVLTQPASDATSIGREIVRRSMTALVIGLAVALVVGFVLSRMLAAPLRRAAEFARRLTRGERGFEVPRDGPAEVVEMTDALNTLGRSLAASERRQREFLTSVSHELRTPLTTLRGYAEALSDGVVAAEPGALERTGRTLLAETERLDMLIADLLALARLEADEFTLQVGTVDLSQLLRDTEAAWNARAETDSIDLRVDVGDAPVHATTDRERVRQVLDGLVANAVRVAEPGMPLVLAARSDGDRAVIEVRDGGPGLSDDDLSVAFDQGVLHERYRGRRPVGSGLGLALVARLVERLGGTVSASHAPEGGAAFTVGLPR